MVENIDLHYSNAVTSNYFRKMNFFNDVLFFYFKFILKTQAIFKKRTHFLK